eukprot:9300998-Alexandrium_andersonii.AAC.1
MSELGFRSHSLDPMLFLYYYDPQHGLTCAVGFRVDDALVACSPRYPLDQLLQAFSWGRWRWLPDPGVFLAETHARVEHGPLLGSIKIA